MKRVYFDYAATTPVDPRVLTAMTPYFTRVYGNASSINVFGQEAKTSLEDSRKTVAGMMNCEPEELIFTGSATEANNLALKGFAFGSRKEKHIAVSTIEHDCVLNSAKWLEKQGWRITFLPVDKHGLLDLGELENTLRKGVALVSVIHANNEIGTVQPVKKIGELSHEYGVVFHTDAAQSFGKIPIDVKDMNIDLLTANAHKIYGPKGVGALFITKHLKIEPLLHGGGHEFGLRASTENIPSIVGFAKAVELRREEMVIEAKKIDQLSKHLVEEVLTIEKSHLNGHPTQRLPNINNFRFAYIEGEALLLLLNEEGIAASTGSACSSKSLEPSHVLLALGLTPEEVHGSLRVSLGKYNTKDDITYLMEVLPKTVEKLRKISPLSNRKKGE
ncbi:cysteine desulfurase [Candidatus Bathyarchaeota archaeon]|nr:cysteine desulfurase [Candidatus Bathyarchaeota archaeon]